MKKAYNFFKMFMLCELGGCVGKLFHVLGDKKQHPEMYSPPYASWLERMDFTLIVTGVTVVVCVTAMIILKILMRKREKKSGQVESAAE